MNNFQVTRAKSNKKNSIKRDFKKEKTRKRINRKHK